MANLNKKIFELSDADLARLAVVRRYRDCPSDVEALRHCIRETHRMDVERVKQSIDDGDPKSFQVVMRETDDKTTPI